MRFQPHFYLRHRLTIEMSNQAKKRKLVLNRGYFYSNRDK